MNQLELEEVLLDSGLLQGACQVTETPITDIYIDSRIVTENSLFVAVKGTQVDGEMFIEKAVEKGANTIICQTLPNHLHPQVAYFVVHNAQQALAEAAMLFYEYPTYDIGLIGITGTNGKTTTTYLLHYTLNHLGEKTGLLGTIAYKIGEEEFISTHTTPDAITLNALFRKMEDAECATCVMEVSSHALAQDRTYGLQFGVVAFTNLTRDHLDYHQTFEAYVDAKKILFDGLEDVAVAIVNVDDEYHEYLIKDTKAQVVSYGQDASASYSFKIVENKIDGLTLQIGAHTAKFRLVGEFNAYNLVCAFAILCATGYAEEDALAALSTAPPVPGRFEQIDLGNDIFGIVDYAHTPDALQNVLETVQTVKASGSKVWCVFGCGGDRDKGKRSEMGAIAERLSDFPVLTSDNPRTENPQDILNDVLGGISDKHKVTTLIDRREAIQYAVKNAKQGDIVVVAGKGHETYQIVGTEKIDFDDKEVLLSVR